MHGCGTGSAPYFATFSNCPINVGMTVVDNSMMLQMKIVHLDQGCGAEVWFGCEHYVSVGWGRTIPSPS